VGVAWRVHGLKGHFAWAERLNRLQPPDGPDENLGMTTRTSTQIARQATPFPPSQRLAALHRKAGEAAILRDGRLEIAIDDSGAVSARVVAAC
jgi:hypothetical protein